MSLQIRALKDDRIEDFINFPYALFEGDRYWVGDLKSNVRYLLSPRHPFWLHGERALFVAYREGRAVGRVAAVINRAYNTFHEDNTGFFGFFDCENDPEAAEALLGSAENYLEKKGLDHVIGPVNPSTNETCGLLIDGFDGLPMIMMPYNPEYYIKLVEGAGYAKAKDLFAYRIDVSKGFSPRYEKIIKRLERGNIRIREADVKQLDKEIASVKKIYNGAWEKNWGFVPMTDREFFEEAASLKWVVKPEYLYFAEVNGVPAGFVLLLPNLNVPLKVLNGSLGPFNIFPFLYRMLFKMDSGRLLTLGVLKEYRSRGIEMLLIKKALESAAKAKWSYGEMSWTLEDNSLINRTIDSVGGELYRKYRLYGKKLG